MSLSVLYKGKIHSIDFKDEYEKYQQDWTSNLTFLELKERLALKFKLQPENIKLLFGGGRNN